MPKGTGDVLRHLSKLSPANRLEFSQASSDGYCSAPAGLTAYFADAAGSVARTYVRQLNFLGWVSRSYEKIVLLAHRNRAPNEMKKITEDVQAIVDHLSLKLGTTWHEASAPRAHGNSLLVQPPRSVRPWQAVGDAARS
eukprot:scaffold4592_cov132-Isochrysis_galbana.AAC.1